MAENCLEWENKRDKLRAIRVCWEMIHYLFTLSPTLLYIQIKPYALWSIDMFIDRINGHSVSYLVFRLYEGLFCFSPPQ